jgi:hypothetical protein
MALFRNSYHCDPCEVSWEDIWDSSCNDRCPKCRQETCPEGSEDITPDDPAEVGFTTSRQVLNRFP